jgi:hypothetical protein
MPRKPAIASRSTVWLSSRVEAAEVDGQLAIDEGPKIVVAGEGEDLAALVGEGGVDLGGEVEVVQNCPRCPSPGRRSGRRSGR